MTPSRDEVIRMAEEVGAGRLMTLRTADEQRWTGLMPLEALERFAALVAAAEREQCAKLCEQQAAEHVPFSDMPRIEMANHCAFEIRERSAA